MQPICLRRQFLRIAEKFRWDACRSVFRFFSFIQMIRSGRCGGNPSV